MDESYVLQYPELERSHFWWKIRREMVIRLIAERIELEGVRILDVGCGAGVTINTLASLGALVEGIEVDSRFRNTMVPASGVIRYGDFLSMEIPNSYEVVLMMDVLEHIHEEAAALGRVGQVLEEGGLLVITVPAYDWLWSSHDVINQHHRRYTSRSLRKVLEDSGLTVQVCGYMFAGLVIPKLLSRWLERLTGNALQQGGLLTEGAVARLAEKWFKVELWWAVRSRRLLPTGTSVVAVATRH